jgi:hypothetical protein
MVKAKSDKVLAEALTGSQMYAFGHNLPAYA